MSQFPIQVYTENEVRTIESLEAYKALLEQYTYIRAAGGWIVNERGEVLMIFRREKWDLPKGKVEADELNEQAALREVEEETGIKAEIIDNKSVSTFHTYNTYGDDMLKETVWFRMRAQSTQTLKPQTEEDIAEVCWVPEQEVFEKLNLSYPSLGDLVRKIQQENPKNENI